MGNENEIARGVVQGHSLFLPDEIHDQEGAAQVYVLEEEFARTRKNKNYRLYLFMLVFVTVVLGGLFLFKLYRDWRDKTVDVDITEFEDLRLKEVIDSARKRGSNIDVMRIEMQMLDVAMLEDLLRVRRDTHDREMGILARNLPDDETDREVAAARKDGDARLKKVKAAYQSLMRRKKSEIYALEDAREKEVKELAAKGAEGRVSNTDRLYSLQMKKLKEKQDTGVEALRKYYDNYMNFITMEYNPVLDAPPVSSIIGAKPDAPPAGGGPFREYDPLLADSGFSAGDFGLLRKKMGDQSVLLKRLMRVPYRNSVPPALRALSGFSGSIARAYDDLWWGLARSLRERNQLLKQYEYLFDSVLDTKKENGLVLDPRDAGNILVRMNRSLKIDDGQAASVYNGDRYVGKIRLLRDGRGGYRAKLVSLAGKGAALQPTNRIILEVKK